MATPYELIEGTRPRIRRDVLFTQSPTGVLFHNANGGFNVSGSSAYRFASLIVPHLDGSRRVAELCAGLGPKQRDMVFDLVRTLYDRGFARDVPVEDTGTSLPAAVAQQFAPQIDYIDHYVGTAAARFERFRGARVAVLGEDPVARWCVLSLIRNGAADVAVQPGIGAAHNDFAQVLAEAEELRGQGCACEIIELPGDGRLGWPQLESRDLVLVTGTDAPLRVLSLLEAGVPDGTKLLAAWTFGDYAVIGPLMGSGTVGCFVCAALRLGANGDPAAAADLWSAAAVPGAVAAPRNLTGPLAGMVGNMLAYEVFRERTGALPAETAGKLIIQDLDSLDTWSEPLYPHPRCPRCASATASEPESQEPWIPVGQEEPARAADPATVAGDAGPVPVALDDPAAVLAKLESISVLVQARAGVFRAFGDEAWNQTPIKVGTVRLGLGHGGRREVTAFDLHHVAGARIRALHVAARVYTEHVIPVGAVLRGAELDLAREKWPVIEPARLAVASGTLAAGAQVDAWARAFRLAGRETVLVPAASLRTLGSDNSSLICLPTCAGTGTGGSRADAVADGLLSALALDAVVGAVRGRVPVRLVQQRLLEADAELGFLAKAAHNLGVEVELLDLGEPDGRPAPVLFARTTSSQDTESRWTVGCAASWQEAATAALRDLLGAIQIERQLGRRDGAAGLVDPGDVLLGDLDSGALAVSGEAGPGPDAPTPWAEIQRRVRADGNDIVVAPIEAPDLAAGGIWAAKVLLVRGIADER